MCAARSRSVSTTPTSSTSHSSAKTSMWYWPMWPAPTTLARSRRPPTAVIRAPPARARRREARAEGQPVSVLEHAPLGRGHAVAPEPDEVHAVDGAGVAVDEHVGRHVLGDLREPAHVREGAR